MAFTWQGAEAVASCVLFWRDEQAVLYAARARHRPAKRSLELYSAGESWSVPDSSAALIPLIPLLTAHSPLSAT